MRLLPDPVRHFPRQALHAVYLELQHPSAGKAVHFRSPLPPELAHLLEQLEQHAPAG